MEAFDELRKRARHAQAVLHMARQSVSDFGLRVDERTATVIPLVLASMDNAYTIMTLLDRQPDRSWVSGLVLQRTQMEYVLRAAFFARAANTKELMRFRAKGRMPDRGKRQIHVMSLAEEAAGHLGWDKAKLLASVKCHQKQLSSLVHGGREILGIYTQHDEWGNIDIDWAELAAHIDTVSVYVMLGMAVAMSLSPLDEVALDEAVRPAYAAAHEYFTAFGNPIET